MCAALLQVTYAEPAIASLRPLAVLVEKERAPYLYFALNEKLVGVDDRGQP